MYHVFIQHKLTHKACWTIDRDKLQRVLKVFDELIIIIRHRGIVTQMRHQLSNVAAGTLLQNHIWALLHQ